MRVELQRAIVLHRRAWRDTSLLLEAFSREYGRVVVIAKGARRSRSRWRGLLEPLSLTELSWSGRGEVYTLTAAELVNKSLFGGQALMSGLYAAELLLRLTGRDDPHPGIYDSLQALLAALAQDVPAIVALRFFERDLLAELGYGLDLQYCAQGQPIEARQWYIYHPEDGLLPWPGHQPPGSTVVAGQSLLALHQGQLSTRAQARQMRDLLKNALAPHLGARPLKSVQTLQAMQQFSARDRQ